MARTLSAREARHFVAAWLAEQTPSSPFGSRVTLSVSELSANAVLHTARPFTVSVLDADNGAIRLEVIDSAPHLVPVRVPTHGTAVDLTRLSETGRGLQIVSAVANRWGIALAPNVKTVWCEFDGPEPASPTEPVIEDGRAKPPKGPGVYKLCFTAMPVRAAIASGLDVEEAIRDVQIDDTRSTAPEHKELLDLVDRTASLRLAGRHAALDASSRDETVFDLEVETTDEEMAATAQLNGALAARGRRGPSAEVIAFRTWLVEETIRQRRGDPPSPFPEGPLR